MVSAASAATEILKWAILTFVLYLNIVFSE